MSFLGKKIITLKTLILIYAQQNENHRRKRRALEISAASLTLQLPLHKQLLPNSA